MYHPVLKTEPQFTYLRFSLTDRCQFRCLYCLPEKKPLWDLHVRPWEKAVRRKAFAVLRSIGLRKIRLTGGEPLLSPQLFETLKDAQAAGFDEIAMTTNGDLLAQKAEALAAAGLQRINVHMDAAREETFDWITQTQGRWRRIRAGIRAAQKAGLSPIKLNAVLLRSTFEQWEELLAFAAEERVELRFIELMPTMGFSSFFEKEFVPIRKLQEAIGKRHALQPLPRRALDGPARVFELSALRLRVGFIGSSCKDFCASCNRLRLTAQGVVKRCLFEPGGFPLRAVLEEGENEETARARLVHFLFAKESFNPHGDPLQVKEKFSLSKVGG